MRHQQNQNQKHNFHQRCSRALCCSCRLSVSSEPESSATSSSSSSERFGLISTLAHAMVQERLDQMIKERRDEVQPRNNNNNNNINVSSSSKNVMRQQRSNSSCSGGATKFVLMVAMEKCTDDPREDFRESMVEMIIANRIEETRDLRTLLNYYVTMNSEEYYGVILDVFHQVCSTLFLYSCNKP